MQLQQIFKGRGAMAGFVAHPLYIHAYNKISETVYGTHGRGLQSIHMAANQNGKETTNTISSNFKQRYIMHIKMSIYDLK
jgi:hypothetical protein